MLKIRRSRNCLIFNMWIPIPRKDGPYIGGLRIVSGIWYMASNWLAISDQEYLICMDSVSGEHGTWTQTDWHRPFVIGWSKYGFGNASLQWSLASRERCEFPSSLKAIDSPHLQPLHARRIWNSLFCCRLPGSSVHIDFKVYHLNMKDCLSMCRYFYYTDKKVTRPSHSYNLNCYCDKKMSSYCKIFPARHNNSNRVWEMNDASRGQHL